MDPDGDDSNGIDERSQHAMLRLDAMVMRVQLNVRFLLEVRPSSWSLLQDLEQPHFQTSEVAEGAIVFKVHLPKYGSQDLVFST